MNYNEFLGWVDMQKFSKACHNISTSPGTQILNEHSNRMLKEKFILGALQLCNHAKNIHWIDTIDYDLIFEAWNNATIEVKTGDGLVYTDKRGDSKDFVEVKLKNIYESKQNTRTTLDKKFDHLMIVQNTGTFAVGFVPFDVATKYLELLSDGWKSRIPFDQITVIYTENMRTQPSTWNINLDPKIWVSNVLTEAGL